MPKKSKCHQERRYSPSVASFRPISSCLAMIFPISRSSTSLSWAGVISPFSRCERAAFSGILRRKLPTWSARNGGFRWAIGSSLHPLQSPRNLIILAGRDIDPHSHHLFWLASISDRGGPKRLAGVGSIARWSLKERTHGLQESRGGNPGLRQHCQDDAQLANRRLRLSGCGTR